MPAKRRWIIPASPALPAGKHPDALFCRPLRGCDRLLDHTLLELSSRQRAHDVGEGLCSSLQSPETTPVLTYKQSDKRSSPAPFTSDLPRLHTNHALLMPRAGATELHSVAAAAAAMLWPTSTAPRPQQRWLQSGMMLVAEQIGCREESNTRGGQQNVASRGERGGSS